MTLMVPIPSPKKEAEVYFLPYKIGSGYMNQTLKIKYDENDNMRNVREMVSSQYGFSNGSYAIAKVYNNGFSRLFNT